MYIMCFKDTRIYDIVAIMVEIIRPAHTDTEPLISYRDALSFMDARVAEIRNGSADECVWLLSHPSLYTRGVRARACDLRDPDRFPVYDSGRGGQFTYHGPGQRVIYLMLDLRRREQDIRGFVHRQAAWIARVLNEFGIEAHPDSEQIGVWVDMPRRAKIAAIGVRVRHWISLHGSALNVSPDLSHYDGIVPCGIENCVMTSLADLGHKVSMDEVDDVLVAHFDTFFGR